MNNLVETIIKELTEVEPFEITVDPRPNLKTDPIEKQGEDI
jgi:metal-sulfur cluster biosynthetic enzyme